VDTDLTAGQFMRRSTSEEEVAEQEENVRERAREKETEAHEESVRVRTREMEMEEQEDLEDVERLDGEDDASDDESRLRRWRGPAVQQLSQIATAHAKKKRRREHEKSQVKCEWAVSGGASATRGGTQERPIRID
jgi:hypothetical protein